MSKMIQIRNVPDDLHRALKIRAAANGQTLSDYLMGEVREIAKRPSPAEIRATLLQRSPSKVRESPVRALRSQRDVPTWKYLRKLHGRLEPTRQHREE